MRNADDQLVEHHNDHGALLDVIASCQWCPPLDDGDSHHCCYHVAAAKAVLADRERELLEIKGPCRTDGCPLHYAHSGPCNVVTRPNGSTVDRVPSRVQARDEPCADPANCDVHRATTAPYPSCPQDEGTGDCKHTAANQQCPVTGDSRAVDRG